MLFIKSSSHCTFSTTDMQEIGNFSFVIAKLIKTVALKLCYDMRLNGTIKNAKEKINNNTSY